MAKAKIKIVSASKQFDEHAAQLMRRFVNVLISQYNLSASLELSETKTSNYEKESKSFQFKRGTLTQSNDRSRIPRRQRKRA